MTLRGRPDHAASVAVFDGTALVTAALAAPEAMGHYPCAATWRAVLRTRKANAISPMP
jgi:hypothetical protein